MSAHNLTLKELSFYAFYQEEKEALNRERVKICEHDLFLFSQTFLSHHFTLDYCSFHTDLFKDLSDKRTNKRLARIAPRGHGKTTIVITAFILWNLCYKKKEFVLIFGASQEHANQNLQKVIEEMESNQRIADCFPELKPSMDKKNQFKAYRDSLAIFEGGLILAAKGMRGSVRGISIQNKRPDLVIIDDPEKDVEVESSRAREQSQRKFESVIKYLGDASKPMDVIMIDTVKHPDALIKYASTKQGWDSKSYSAVETDENGVRSAMWKSVYCLDVANMIPWEIRNWDKKGSKGYERIRQPFYGKYFENETDSEPLFVGLGEGTPTEQSMFRQEMLNEPYLAEQMPLRKEFWTYFDYTDETVIECGYRIMGIDLSAGKTKKSDFQAISVIGKLGKDYLLLDGLLRKLNLVSQKTADLAQNTLAGVICDAIVKYRVNAVYIEDNGMQGLFMAAIAKMVKKYRAAGKIDFPCQIIPKTSKGNKETRILYNLGMLLQDGRFKLRSDYQRVYYDFVKQFDIFTLSGKAENDDAPDSCNIAVYHDIIMQSKRLRGY